MNDNKIGLRIVAGLVLLAAIAGIAFFAFQAGVANGSPVTLQAPSGESMPAPDMYHGYRYMMPFHPFGFGLGCFGLLIPLFLFFLAMRAFRFIFWGPRWGWGHHHGHWGRHWEGGAPPMFDEWHKQAHGDKESQESAKDKE